MVIFHIELTYGFALSLVPSVQIAWNGSPVLNDKEWYIMVIQGM